MYQYKIDELRFSDLLHKYTGISKTKIDKFIKDNPVSNIFDHPTSLSATPDQIRKLNELKEMLSLYKTLKQAGPAQYRMCSSRDAGDYFKTLFGNQKDKESFVCTFLDTGNNVIATKILSVGTVNQAPIFPRELVKEAILYDAASIMVAHNHPGGSLTPSNEDKNVTKLLINALSSVNIPLIDHIIVVKGSYYSFQEDGLMNTLKSSANTVFESICQQYNASYPAIKYISAETANSLEYLNLMAGKMLFVDEIRDMYVSAGYKLEITGTDQDKDSFNSLKDVVEDLRHAQLLQKNEQSAGKGIDKSIDLDR